MRCTRLCFWATKPMPPRRPRWPRAAVRPSRLAEELDLAGGRPDEAEAAFEERRFAGAVGADQRDLLAAADIAKSTPEKTERPAAVADREVARTARSGVVRPRPAWPARVAPGRIRTACGSRASPARHHSPTNADVFGMADRGVHGADRVVGLVVDGDEIHAAEALVVAADRDDRLDDAAPSPPTMAVRIAFTTAGSTCEPAIRRSFGRSPERAMTRNEPGGTLVSLLRTPLTQLV